MKKDVLDWLANEEHSTDATANSSAVFKRKILKPLRSESGNPKNIKNPVLDDLSQSKDKSIQQKRRREKPMFNPYSIYIKKEDVQQKDTRRLVALVEKRFGLSLTGKFCSRRQPDYNDPYVEIDRKKLHLYGIDFMEPEALFEYFAYFAPKNIVFLDSSSANVEFDDEETATMALNSNVSQRPPTKPSLILDQEPGYEPLLPETPLDQEQWFELVPYFALGVERRIQARYATNQDEKSEKFEDKMPIFRKVKKQLEQCGIIRQWDRTTRINSKKLVEEAHQHGIRSNNFQRYNSKSYKKNASQNRSVDSIQKDFEDYMNMARKMAKKR